MAEIDKQTNGDDLIRRAGTDAEALGRLYDLYYEPIFRFCGHRLFNRQIAEDITSAVFLAVAQKIGSFKGRTEENFRNWLYAIAANQANAHIRKSSRRRHLFAEAAMSMTDNNTDCPDELDWPELYAAILKLKPKHQTIVTLRFFENLDFEQIGKITNTRPATVRVTLHRILEKLRGLLAE